MKYNTHSRIYAIARGLLIAASTLALLFGLASNGRADMPRDIPQRAASDILQECALEFWQRVNAARQDPLGTAARLEIPAATVRQVFATQEWVLEQGLPPLAWNHVLAHSATIHGRDMFERFYYDYVNPEGLTYWDRIEAAGYIPAEAGETINALFFENLIPVEEGLGILVDTMLRDELTGNPAVERNIFNPDFIEMGAGFFAESIPLLGEQPYAYLLLADFARTHEAPTYVIGTYPLDCSVVMRPTMTGGWFSVHSDLSPVQLPAGLFQVKLPYGGADFVLLTKHGLGAPVDYASVADEVTGSAQARSTNTNAAVTFKNAGTEL